MHFTNFRIMKMVTIWFFLLAISSLGRLVGSDTFTVGYLAGIGSVILYLKEPPTKYQTIPYLKIHLNKCPANRGRPGREEGYGAPGLRISGAVG